MEIIAVSAIVGIVSFSIGIFCGKSSPCHHEIYCDLYDIRLGKLGSLETKVYMLESENKRLNYLYENLIRDKRMFQETYAAHCITCNKNFYSKDEKGQDVADLLKTLDTSKGVKELAKKLDIEIR